MAMFALKIRSHLASLLSRNCHLDTRAPPLLFAGSFFAASQNRYYTSAPGLNLKNFGLVDYLVVSLKFPKTEALALSRRFPNATSSEKPEAVVCFFKALGFSDIQIQSIFRRQPAILFADTKKTLKPKVAFYQKLGLTGNHLGRIISRNPSLLTSSLDNKLKPSIRVLKKILEVDGSTKSRDYVNDLMFRILSRYPWVIGKDSRLLSSVSYLRNCGIFGSQLIMLLKTEPRIFSLPEAELKNLVSRVTELGFANGSRMLVYGVMTLYCNSAETINRKYELLQSFDFSKDECNQMFVKAPNLFKSSEAKLRGGMEFYLDTLMLDKSVLVNSPAFLTFSVEKRIMPRYKIYQMLKCRNLLDKDRSFLSAVILSNEKFVEKYIMPCADDARELMVAYEGHLLESSKG